MTAEAGRADSPRRHQSEELIENRGYFVSFYRMEWTTLRARH